MLRVQDAGAGAPELLLLHGLGATGDVWAGMLESAGQWPGRVLAPDLPGHGGSAPLARYSFGALAAETATALDPGSEPVVLGHSLGGVVALELASGRFGIRPRSVVGLGIKVTWSEEELARAAALAARETQWFDADDDALARHLRGAGLDPPVPRDHPAARNGVVEESGRFRLALDGAAFGVGAPDMPSLLAAARCPVVLARGEHDALDTDEQLRALVPDPVVLPGLGHNAHVEDPAAVWRLAALAP